MEEWPTNKKRHQSIYLGHADARSLARRLLFLGLQGRHQADPHERFDAWKNGGAGEQTLSRAGHG